MTGKRIRQWQTDLAVTDIFDCIADDADSHVDEISRRHFKHGPRELLTVFVDLLEKQLQDHHGRHCNVVCLLVYCCLGIKDDGTMANSKKTTLFNIMREFECNTSTSM